MQTVERILHTRKQFTVSLLLRGGFTRDTTAVLLLVVDILCSAIWLSTTLPLPKPELLLTPTSMSSVRLAASAADGGGCRWLEADDRPLAHTTRLPSNLRLTTRECVHLVTHGYFRSRDKDGGHAIRSAISEYPTLHATLMALCFTEPELWQIAVSQCRNRDSSTFFALVTLTLTR